MGALKQDSHKQKAECGQLEKGMKNLQSVISGGKSSKAGSCSFRNQ